MHNQIDTSFQTLQNDLFSSGMAAKIGMNAFGLWSAIKNYSNYNTGECWPGMRQLADLTGLSMGTVQKCIKILLEGHLLRIVTGARVCGLTVMWRGNGLMSVSGIACYARLSWIMCRHA